MKLTLITILILSSFSAFAIGTRGGGGGIQQGDKISPFSAVPNAIPNSMPSALRTISPDILLLAKQYAQNLKPWLAPEVYEGFLKALIERDFLYVDEVPQDIINQLNSEYKDYVQRANNPLGFRIVAYTKGNVTYLTSNWDKVKEFDQVIYLFHEAYYALKPNAHLAEVLEFERSILAFLLNNQDLDAQISVAASFPNLLKNHAFAMIVRAFQLNGQPLKLSDLFDSRMAVDPNVSTGSTCGNIDAIGRNKGLMGYSADRSTGIPYRPNVAGWIRIQARSLRFMQFLKNTLWSDGDTFQSLSLIDQFIAVGGPSNLYGGAIALECKYVNGDFSNFVLQTETVDYSTIPYATQRMAASQWPGYSQSHPKLLVVTIHPIDATTTGYYQQSIRRYAPAQLTPATVELRGENN